MVFGYTYPEEPMQTQYIEPEEPRGANADYDDNYEYVEDDIASQSSRSKLIVKGIIAGVIVIALIIAGIFIFRSCTAEPESDTIPLPNFVGMALEDILNNEEYTQNFEFVVEYDTSTEGLEQEGIVLKQNPSGVDEVKTGAEITLTVGGSPEEVEVPPLAGMSREEAEQTLRGMNLVPKVEEVYDDNTADGYVVRSSPGEGETVTEGSTVTILVSQGPATDEYIVPDVIGDYIDTARARITAAGLSVGEVTERDDTGQEAGIVIETDPLQGNRVAQGTAVNIVISSGEMSTKTVDVTVNLPSNVSQDLTLKVYIGGALTETKTVNPAASTQITFSYEGSEGTQEIVYYLDDQKYLVVLVDFDSGTSSVTWQGGVYFADPTPSQPESSTPSEGTENPDGSGEVGRDDNDGEPVG